MNAAMVEKMVKVGEARRVLKDAMEELRQVCDHQDEVGSWDRVYDPSLDRNVCRYCGEDL